MRLSLIIFFLSSVKVLDSCIPTQWANDDWFTTGKNSNGRGSNSGTSVKTTTVGPGGAVTTTSSTTTTTTTTMSTTTTTVTEPPFPCTVCQKVYDNTCQGFGIPNLLQWCPTAAEAGISYTLGLITSIIPFIPAGSCATIVTCPLTTSLRVDFLGAEIPAPVFYAWCEESGPDAGNWFTGASWLLKIPVTSLTCKPIVGG